MGKPGQSELWSPVTEYIGGVELTRGSETSQYPEEEKSTEIPLVAASERGPGQTQGLRFIGGCRAFDMGPWLGS